VVIRGNIVRQCNVGFRLDSALGDDRFERVVIEGNNFDPGALSASFAVVLKRDDPSDDPVIDDFVLANNVWTGAGVLPMARPRSSGSSFVPYDGQQLWRTDGSAGLQATYSCLGSPVGAFDAPVGSIAVRRDGAPGSTLYLKEALTPAGWTPK
jgi:hypothetical protein